MNLLGGLVLALGAGVAAAYWDETQDHRIYSPHTVTEVSGLSTVAVIREEA
jgi:capsular polysaccharide biosynthesis protein